MLIVVFLKYLHQAKLLMGILLLRGCIVNKLYSIFQNNLVNPVLARL